MSAHGPGTESATSTTAPASSFTATWGFSVWAVFFPE
jgi:hypothetical protein